MQSVKEIDFQYVTNQAGEKTAVLLPIAAFEELLEDLDDLAKIDERRGEKTTSQANLITQLKSGGFI